MYDSSRHAITTGIYISGSQTHLDPNLSPQQMLLASNIFGPTPFLPALEMKFLYHQYQSHSSLVMHRVQLGQSLKTLHTI